MLNDRLGKKLRVKCNDDDTIGDLNKPVAAQTGTRAEKIQIQKWLVPFFSCKPCEYFCCYTLLLLIECCYTRKSCGHNRMLLCTYAVNKMSLRLMPCENFPVLIIDARNMGVVGLFLSILFFFLWQCRMVCFFIVEVKQKCVCVCVSYEGYKLVFVREWDHRLCFLSQALSILCKLDMTIISKRLFSWVQFALFISCLYCQVLLLACLP